MRKSLFLSTGLLIYSSHLFIGCHTADRLPDAVRPTVVSGKVRKPREGNPKAPHVHRLIAAIPVGIRTMEAM